MSPISFQRSSRPVSSSLPFFVAFFFAAFVNAMADGTAAAQAATTDPIPQPGSQPGSQPGDLPPQPGDLPPQPGAHPAPPPPGVVPRATPAPAAAPAPAKSRTGFSIAVDQDVFFDFLHTFPQFNEDRNYTMGVAIGIFGPCWRDSFLFAPLRKLDSLTGASAISLDYMNSSRAGDPVTGVEQFTLTILGTAFTPAGKNLNVSTPITDDRPYASILGLGSTHLTVSKDRRTVIKTEFDAAILGLRIGEWVQTRIHRAIRTDPNGRPYDPLGWPHQISDGGEPTARYVYGRRYLVGETRLVDVSVGTETSVGYYTNADLNAIVRIGWRHTPFYAVDANPIGAANQGSDRSQSVLSAPFDLYMFGGLTGKAVLYNALLEGQFRHSDVRVTPANIEHIVAEFQWGVTLGHGDSSLTWAILSGRTPEFHSDKERTHLWSGIYLTVGWD